MPISFRCQTCFNEVTAPDAAAGKRGKCPFCGHANEIPTPLNEEDLIPLAPVDEEEERLRQEEIHQLMAHELELLAEAGQEEVAVPLDAREDITSDDLHHFVVNYCLDMADGKLQRAETYVEKLQGFGVPGVQAIEDFLTGTATEPALDQIPRPVLQEFLKRLKEQVTFAV